MSKKGDIMRVDDIIDAVIHSEDPLASAMEIILTMMALAGNLKDEEYVFQRIEHVIKEARQLLHERHH
jgi:hypothetical protein